MKYLIIAADILLAIIIFLTTRYWFRVLKRRTNNGNESETLAILRRINTLETLSKSGYVEVDVKNKNVLIDLDLASLYLQDAERWSGFMQNVMNWMLYSESSRGWQRVFLEAETKAMREARRAHAYLSLADEQRIRMQARASVNVDDVKPPEPEEYSFMIISKSEKEFKPVIAGIFDGKEVNMFPFSEVKKETSKIG